MPNAYVVPGTDVPSTVPGSRWATVSGASYAAAQLSGLVALLLDARARSAASARPVDADLVRLRDGRIDACASLARASPGCVCACAALPPSPVEAIARH